MLATTAASAQSWPTRPIRLVVPNPPGGAADALPRMLAEALVSRLGQPVVVENRPGAGSTLGIEMVVKAPADGYTFGLIASSYTVTPSLYRLRFDPVADITPIIQFSQGPMLVLVPRALPVASFSELVTLIRSRPGALNYASAGQGSITHLACAYFADMAGLQMTHIPYKGTGPALTDTIAGQTQVFFSSTATALPHVQSGALRALAVTTAERLPALAAVPTIAESGIAGFDVSEWQMLLAPAGTPAMVIERLQREVATALQVPEVRARLTELGATPVGSSTADAQGFLRGELARWAELAKKVGIKPQD